MAVLLWEIEGGRRCTECVTRSTETKRCISLHPLTLVIKSQNSKYKHGSYSSRTYSRNKAWEVILYIDFLYLFFGDDNNLGELTAKCMAQVPDKIQLVVSRGIDSAFGRQGESTSQILS